MAERCIYDEYELRGAKFEVWVEDMNWYLVARTRADADKCGVPIDTVLTEADFCPRLTDEETQRVCDAVYDWYVD